MTRAFVAISCQCPQFGFGPPAVAPESSSGLVVFVFGVSPWGDQKSKNKQNKPKTKPPHTQTSIEKTKNTKTNLDELSGARLWVLRNTATKIKAKGPPLVLKKKLKKPKKEPLVFVCFWHFPLKPKLGPSKFARFVFGFYGFSHVFRFCCFWAWSLFFFVFPRRTNF
jgi:hypothetical protein